MPDTTVQSIQRHTWRLCKPWGISMSCVWHSPSTVRLWKLGINSRLMMSGSTTSANLPRFDAAARRTMGVSSPHRSRNMERSSVLRAGEARRYAVAKSPQADTREVNHSPPASLCREASRLRSQAPGDAAMFSVPTKMWLRQAKRGQQQSSQAEVQPSPQRLQPLHEPQSTGRSKQNRGILAHTLTRGIKNSATLFSGKSWPTLPIDSTALSRTTVSSVQHSDSKGTRRVCAYNGPPTYGTKRPSSSAMANKTSSSSSLLSFRNGMSSLRVRSSPKANAIVLNRFTEFSLRATSSFLSSSLQA